MKENTRKIGMRKKLGCLLGMVMLLLGMSGMVQATVEVPETIRVGLYYGSKAPSSITLSSPGGMEIGVWVGDEFEAWETVRANQEVTVSRGASAGSVQVSGIGEIGSSSEYPYFRSQECDGKSLIVVNGDTYRGNIEIRRFSDSDLTVINHVSMQEYLYGVVPREIGGNSPMEAVKAQAIVARTYAVKNYGKRKGWGFDVYPTVDDQAYGGYEWENVNSNQAVDETDGQVVVYDGELIGGYYFSTSGGYTESSVNVWGGDYAYLKAVPDYFEPEVNGNTTWEVQLTASEVKEKLKNNGINVGEVIDLQPIAYTDAGRVLELKVVGTNGEAKITKQNARTYLGLKSQWYTVNDAAPEVLPIRMEDLPVPGQGKETLPDNSQTGTNQTDKKELEWWEKEDSEYEEKNPDYSLEEDKVKKSTTMKPLLKTIVETIQSWAKENIQEDAIEEKKTTYEAGKGVFTFRGRGWGHAVGMSQNGAKGMAEQGFSCEEIIEWYYSGVEVVSE